jgi:hypothetical protein
MSSALAHRRPDLPPRLPQVGASVEKKKKVQPDMSVGDGPG